MAVHFAKDDAEVETHEINVTPFIDVILVLLIIFMVAAPLATVDIPVDLPGSTAEPRRRPDKPVFLTDQGRSRAGHWRRPDIPRQPCLRARRRYQEQQGRAHLRARRPCGQLWRRDGGDERSALRRLSQDRTGRAGDPGRDKMKAIAWIAGVDQDDELELRRWLLAALVVAAAHTALLAAHLWWPGTTAIPGADAPPLLIDFAPEAAAPETKSDLAPDKEESVESQAAPEKQVVQKVEEQPIVEVPPVETPEPELVIPPKQEVVKEQREQETPKPPIPTESEHPQAQSAPVHHLQSEPRQARAAGRRAQSRAARSHRACFRPTGTWSAPTCSASSARRRAAAVVRPSSASRSTAMDE